jgi:hypothetical protein
LNYLEKSSRPDISFVVHQLVRFVTNPRESHGIAIKYLGQYLLHMLHKGITLNPKQPLELITYVDADFAGTWDPKHAANDPNTV